jgi:hypothetical protein
MLVYSLHNLRSDLDAYAMPRVVTDKQAAAIREVLSGTNPSVPVDVFASGADPEAMEYASELRSAIASGGWEANFAAIDPWGEDNPARNNLQFSNKFLALDRGAGLRVCAVGSNTKPDPKHPTQDTVLARALNDAGIDSGAGGLTNNCAKYSIILEVGKRPADLSDREPILSQFGRWLQRISE